MAYDPGALEAALSAAVGDEPALIAELRGAFFASADAHVSAMRAAGDHSEWRASALRLKSLAASFGAVRLMDAAGEAVAARAIDAGALRKIERVIASLED